jgi:glycosyltransferase involved in cell wall biosynthesis
MRIVQVCPRYSPYIGGVETHVAEISKRLVTRGHDVTILTADPSGRLLPEELIEGVKVKRFRALAPGDAYYFSPSISSYLKGQEGIDVIHAHSYHALPAYFARKANAKMFLFTPHYHGKGHTFFRNLLLKLYKAPGSSVFSRADRIVCVSSFEKELICNDFTGLCDKAIVIPNGVNKKDFNGVMPFHKGSKVILYVGRLEEYKGVQYIIQALPLLEGYELVIIGKGPYRESLMNIARSSGLSGRVKLLEGLSREDLLRWYRTADVFVMLSKFEAYGITVAEALTAGVPCIVAMSSALSEFVDGRSCTGLSLPANINELAGMVKSARFEGVSDKMILDWDDVVDRLLKAYAGE